MSSQRKSLFIFRRFNRRLPGMQRFVPAPASRQIDSQGVYIGGGVGLLFALLASAFHHLTVDDNGDVLAIRIGLVTLFRRPVN